MLSLNQVVPFSDKTVRFSKLAVRSALVAVLLAASLAAPAALPTESVSALGGERRGGGGVSLP